MTRQCLSAMCGVLFLASCADLGLGPGLPGNDSDQVTIPQGIWGNVWFWEGDFMPGPPGGHSGKVTPVEREIFIYEATRFDSVVSANGGFYSKILTHLKARTKSNAKGFYQIALPPGKYSVFVVEDSKFYANGTDGAGHILPGTVSENSVTQVQVDITYKATY
jgi:hypothetical protein